MHTPRKQSPVDACPRSISITIEMSFPCVCAREREREGGRERERQRHRRNIVPLCVSVCVYEQRHHRHIVPLCVCARARVCMQWNRTHARNSVNIDS
jgi:hypothetical protein